MKEGSSPISSFLERLGTNVDVELRELVENEKSPSARSNGLAILSLVNGPSNDATEGGTSLAFTANALTHSPSFSELKRRSKHATFVVDDDTPDSIVVGIGEDMDSHFTRFKTLKINKATGAIARLETDQSLQDKWQVEFQPNN